MSHHTVDPRRSHDICAEGRKKKRHIITRQDYNHCRPHSSLGDLTPAAFAGRTVTKHNDGLSEAENLKSAVI